MRHPTPAIAFLVCIGFAAPAAAAEGRDIAEGWRAWARSLVVDGLSIAIGGVREEDGGRTTVVEDISIGLQMGARTADETGGAPRRPAFAASIEIPATRFVELRRADGGVTAASITAPSAAARWEFVPRDGSEGQVAGYSFGAISVEESFLPSFPDIVNDPSRPFSRFEPLFRAALQLSSRRFAIASAELNGSGPGSRFTASYGALIAEGNRDGTNERLSMDGIHIALEVAKSVVRPGSPQTGSFPELRIDYGRTVATRHSIAPFVSMLFDGSVGEGDAGLMAGELVQSGLTLSNADFSLDIGEIAMSDFRASGTTGRLAEAIDVLLLDNGHAPQTSEAGADLMLGMYGAMSAAKVAIAGIDLRVRGGSQSTGRIEFDDLSREGIGRIAVHDWTGTGTQQGRTASFALRQLTVRSLGFPSRDAFLAMERLAEPPPAGQPPPVPTLRQVLDFMPMVGAIELDDYSADLSAGVTMAFERFALTMKDPIPPVPTDISAAIVGLEMPAAIGHPQVAGFLADAGVDTLRFDARLAARWSEADDSLAVSPLSFSIAGLGTFEASLALSGVPRSIFEDPSTMQRAMPTMLVEGVEARFADAPKLAGPLAAYAQRQAVTTDAAVAELGDVVRRRLGPTTGDAFATSAADAVEQFLAGPTGSLMLTARPAQPVPLVQVVGAATMAPGSLVKLLNAVVEYRQ